jgi:hypothetical protein
MSFEVKTFTFHKKANLARSAKPASKAEQEIVGRFARVVGTVVGS